MRAAALLRGLAAAAVVVAAFLAGRCSAESEHTGTDASDAGNAPRTDPPPQRPRGPRDAPRRAAQSAAGAPDADDTDASDDAPDVASATGDATAADIAVDVVVTDADGAPVEDPEVYALPPGEPGSNDPSEIPWKEADEAGRARLHVIRAGRYDIGAVSGVFSAMARDVAVPAPAPIRLTLPPAATVSVRFEAPFEVDANGLPLSPGVSVHRAGDTPTHPYPGRAEAVDVSWTLGFTPDQLAQEFTVPTGTRLWLQVPEGLVADPSEFAAPSTVVIRPDTRPMLHFRVRFEPADFVPPEKFDLVVEFDAGPGSLPRHASIGWALPAGKPLREGEAGVWRRYVPDQPCTLRWTDDLVRPGEVHVADPKSATEAAPVEVVVHVRTERFLESAPPSARLRLRFASDPVLDAAQPQVAWCAWRGAEFESGMVDWTSGETHLDNANADWIAAATGLSVAGPVRAPAADGAVVDLAFRPGGCLVVVPSGDIPSGYGQLTLRRTDGAPIPSREPDSEESRFDLAMPVHAGLLLGPLPPGDVAFDVLLGRTRIAGITGRVQAGRYVPLTVPVRWRK